MREIKFRCWNTDKNEMQWLEFDDDWTFYKGELCHRNTPLYPVMQYTGLKDKNGVEIYEGDILLIEGRRVKTIFRNGGFTFQWETDEHHFYHPDYCAVAEVIGNIYQNPELLK